MTVDEYEDLRIGDVLLWTHAEGGTYEFVRAGPTIFGDMALCGVYEPGFDGTGSFIIGIERLFLFEFWETGDGLGPIKWKAELKR